LERLLTLPLASGPIHLSLQGKLFSSANCGLVK